MRARRTKIGAAIGPASESPAAFHKLFNGSLRQEFFPAVERWWRIHRRDLPWRRTSDPYRIFVSEVMLQQTQVARVVPAYRAFLRRFPSVRQLAAADQAAVIRCWVGLGYNRRARALHRAAQMIASEYRDQMPLSLETLYGLPGVGEYTARAVLVFAKDAPLLPLDTNIRRVLIRHFGQRTPRDLQIFADGLARRRGGRNLAQMLMDFGALVCTSRRPRCVTLGLSHVAEALPVPRQKPFVNSDRFYRGRIVAVLSRSRSVLAVTELRRRIAAPGIGQIPMTRLRRILGALDREAIIDFSLRAKKVRLANGR
ncbi:MAG: A/G-specific adenine glycosylase [Candidatus Terrybacteria bacterium]|nr:A/G-specific adenine glycosylase [Candidatus Terrybacteria bacterium]